MIGSFEEPRKQIMPPIISIIVPVYKVEHILHKCINSIIAQTFSEFELILIDDGSPDNSGKICDEYAANDGRIRVIHKINEGPGSARNSGIDMATGEYLAFVDSDDWIEPDMYEIMYNNLVSNDADISVCGYFFDVKGRKSKIEVDSLKVFNKLEALRYLFDSDKCQNFLWNKFYKKSLFDNIRIPNGRLCEDLDIQYKLFAKANKVTYIEKPLYHYIYGKNSLSGFKFNSDKLNAQTYAYNCVEYINEYFPVLSDYANKQYILVCYGLVKIIIINGCISEYKQQLNTLYIGVIKSYFNISNKKVIEMKLQNDIKLIMKSKKLYEFKTILKFKCRSFAKKTINYILKK